MPMQRDLYPQNWEQIALEVKQAAHWICQECGRPCRKPRESWDELIDRVAPITANYTRDNYWGIQDEQGNWKFGRFTLTVAHLDHDPSNSDPNNLKALCSVCHCRYDLQPSSMARKKMLKRERNGQLTLQLGS